MKLVIVVILIILHFSCKSEHEKAEIYKEKINNKQREMSVSGNSANDQDYEELLKLFINLEKYEYTSYANNSIAMCYLQFGNRTEAIKVYNQTLKIDSCDIAANYALGLINKRDGKLNNATRYLSRLISIVDSKLSVDLEADIYLHIEKIKAMALISKEQANEYVDSLLSIGGSKEVNFVLRSE